MGSFYQNALVTIIKLVYNIMGFGLYVHTIRKKMIQQEGETSWDLLMRLNKEQSKSRKQ